MKIRRGDTVEVIGGNNKGHRGEVMRVLPSKARVVVQGANIRKKHQRQIQTGGRTMNPGIIQFEAPIHISNVALYNAMTGQGDRIGFKRLEDGKKVRIYKSTGEVVDV